MDKRKQALFCLLLTCIFAVCIKSDFIRFLVGFEVMVFLLLYFEVRYLYKKVEVELIFQEKVISIEDNFTIRLHVINCSRLPVTKARIQLQIYDKWADKEMVASTAVMLDCKETGSICLDFSPGYCGAYEIKVRSIRVWDQLGIFSLLRKMDSHENTLHIIPLETSQQGRNPALGDEVSDGSQDSFRKGSMATDTAEIREYRTGDDVRHIHWKLSTKLQNIMVRELGEPSEYMEQIYLNLRYFEKSFTREQWESFLHLVAKVSQELLAAGLSHEVFWVDIQVRKLLSYRVTDEISLQEMLCALLHAKPWKDGTVGEVFEEIQWNESMEEIIEINLKGEVASSGR